MAKKPDPIEGLLAGLAEVSEGSLATLDERISAKEAEIEDATVKMRKELAGLLALRKLVEVAVNGPKARKKPERRGEAGAGDDSQTELRNRIHDFLTAEKRPVPLKEIARSVSTHHLRVKKLLAHEWFKKNGSGYEIAKS